MPRILGSVGLWGTCLLMGIGGGTSLAARPAENLFPNTTAGFVAVANWDDLKDHWRQTQWGKLAADPVMKPFEKDLRHQLQQRWKGIRERLGLTLEDLEGVPGGEVAIGLIRPAPNQAVTALVVDVTGHLPQANAMLEKVRVNLTKSGAKQTKLAVGGTTVTQYDLPRRPHDDVDAPLRKSFYFLVGTLLGVADSLEIVQGILRRIPADQGDSLADVPAYQAVMKRAQTDAAHGPKQIRWFMFPLNYAEAARTNTPERERRKGKSVVDIMRHQGFAAVQGVGGMADLATDGYELIHRTAVFAPPPYEKSMKMLSFPNGSDFKPQSWVPRDIATYTSFYADILNGFDNFGPMFDELFGEGEKGTWTEVLKGLRDQPDGPQVDLRNDLFVHLGRRVSMMSDYQLPITTTSERLLFAIEAVNTKPVAAAIEKLMKNDKTAKRREFQGHVIWEMVEEEQPNIPKVNIGDIPSLTPTLDPSKKKKTEDDEPEQVRLLPHAAVTVANGHLLIASHLDFLLKVLRPIEDRETLARSLDYRVITATLDQLGLKEQFLRTFSRTDEEYRPSYELLKQGKMPESETMLSRVANVLSGQGQKKKAPRQQQIDASKLPDYQVVRRYLGPAGNVGTSEAKGWFFKGIMLSKESPGAIGVATGGQTTPAK